AVLAHCQARHMTHWTPVNTQRRWWIALLLAFIAFWFIRTARSGAPFVPTSDTAVIESFTRLAVDGNLQLGPYSRFQWHHPGPLYFYAMAPMYFFSGGKTTGLNAAALVLNLAGLAIALWLIARHATQILGVALALSVLLFVWRVPELLVSPWNPHVPVIAA